MRMQQTGMSGTSGQVKPEEKVRNHLINIYSRASYAYWFSLLPKHNLLVDIAKQNFRLIQLKIKHLYQT